MIKPCDEEEIAKLVLFYCRYKDATTKKWDKENAQVVAINNKCIELCKKDYIVETIKNEDGQLCRTYPLEIIILVNKKEPNNSETGTPRRKLNSAKELKSLIVLGRYARVRTRFPCPVILLGDKNICRSSTLSQRLEATLQSTANSIKDSVIRRVRSSYSSSNNNSTDSEDIINPSEINAFATTDDDWSTMDRYRNFDIQLIQRLSVG
eukprot:TRINITY_DN10076_c0_g1_i4.p1 TRINITY_DN10076_c0_g1~~TRINITY_DN10076_c0_g1_i4.p1  ORF type:complete len:208 (+),score=29.76 TRINITY_DN10076_c0_g1_i4:67-690(+)